MQDFYAYFYNNIEEEKGKKYIYVYTSRQKK